MLFCVKVAAPLTANAPVWVSAPLMSTSSVPLTVLVPSAVAPLFTRLTLLPLRLTAPVKLLPELVNAIAFAPALKLDAPPTVNAPACVMPPVEVVTDRPPAPMVNASALKLPLLVLRRVSAFVPPTTPPKLARPLVFTVRLCAPLTVPPKSIAPPPVLFSVASLASVTASL